MANATDELTLLERVFLRIGSADTDEQLQSAVSKFLPPVLLKLSSQQDGVRKKVMELLVHINKRIKSRPLVQLPVDALLLQYQDPSASSFVTNFTIIYIKLGYPRLPITKQAELVPCILNALEGKPQSHQDSLLLILMPVLGHVSVPSDPKKRSALFGLNDRPHISKMLADFMLDLLLLPYGATAQQDQQQQSSQQQGASSSNSGGGGGGGAGSGSGGGSSGSGSGNNSFPVPLGMSEYSFKRVTGENPMKPEELEQAKLGVVKFLSGGVMPDADILIHLIVAAADTRFNVANAADMELKKIVGSLDWGSPTLMAPLYQLFLGTQLLATKARPSVTKPELRRQPVGTRIRLKILPYLCRARGPALMFPACIQVFFDSLYGANTNPRLKNMALQFSLLIILGSNLQRLAPVAGVLLSGLLKLISEEDGSLKTLAYSAAGKLGHRVPSLVNKDLALLQTFFEALSQEEPDTRMSVREALLSMVDAFKLGLQNSADASSRAVLMDALLASQVESVEPMARFVAVRYAATVFPADHSPSRYLLLLASGDSKDEVSTEALKALYNPKTNQEPDQSQRSKEVSNESKMVQLVLPSFEEMVNFIFDKAQARMQNINTRHVQGTHTLPFSPNTFTEVVMYLHLCLGKAAEVPVVSREATVQQHPSKHTPLIGRYLRHLCETTAGYNTTEHYLQLIQQLVSANASAVPLACLLEAVGSAPELLASRFTEKLSWLRGYLTSAKEKMREASAQMYGIVIAHGLNDQQFDSSVKELIASIKGKNLEAQHGCILALAHALERRVTLLKNEEKTDKLLSWPAYKEGVHTIVSMLNHQHVLILGAACVSVGILARCYALPLPNGSCEKPMGKQDVVKRLQEVMSNAKLTTKVKERAALACGFLCVGEQFPHSRIIMQGFLDMGKESRDVEMHFTIGEALICCVKGQASSDARDVWNVLESEYAPPESVVNASNVDLEWLLDQLLKKLAPDPHPNLRQASCIWLLAVLKHCPNQQPVIDRLEAMQRVFLDYLSENNDIVQDVASKGLGLVYESSSGESRTQLVNTLLDQLMSGRRSVVQVTGETKLFEDGQLGTAPTGGNLSTYKELCSLASDLNQPDLIYKFMNLANNNAIWNSKKGAAFGFSSIAIASGEQLAAYLPKIVPRLYRYQYDPTPRIQASMASIWKALVPEPQKAVDQYHSEILEDLVTNLTNSQWRVRTSCCLALADFLRSGNKTLLDCLPKLPQLWTQLFRVMDDVHEGTRQAATNTVRILSKLTVRSCDTNQGKGSEELMSVILPILLQNGISSTVSEIRIASLQCISQLVGAAGPLLRPHLPLLIPALLEATSEMELRGLSHLSVQYSAEQQKQEKIDSLRASAAKSHYTTETVSKCVQYMDASALEQLIPRLLELMKGSVGLATRVASAHFIVLLTHHLKIELQPYTGKLLSALFNGLLDRNAVVRKNYATTIGYLLSTAKDSSVEKLFTKIRQWYFEKEDDSVRSALAFTLLAIGQHNQELLKEHAPVILPLVFLAMHACKLPEGSSVEIWEEVWQESTPGTEGGIRQHAPEIIMTLKEALESPSWTMKAQAANAIATVANKIGPFLDKEFCNDLISILVCGLSGRTWNGKENLLKALSTLCTSCKDLLKNEDCSSLIGAVFKECRKDQLSYKRNALVALGDILSALEVDRFDEVYSIVQDVLTESSAENGHSEDDESSRQEQLLQLKEVVYETLGKAWPSNPETQVRYHEQLLEQCVSHLEGSTRGVQVAMIAALHHYVSKLHLLEPSALEDISNQEILSTIIAQISKALIYALGVAKHTRLKKEALNVLYLLVKRLQETKQTAILQMVTESLWDHLEEAGRENAPEIKSRVVDIKELIKS
ncbi:hypothetical protein R5R35_006031 [Gryllus longicercus]|uniref:Proteasome-associated protein ECM29 homolog n=1 Tax=Gryllus longicercus TaxID=2509291 RepID=A0AAN9Z9I0_9ORTH